MAKQHPTIEETEERAQYFARRDWGDSITPNDISEEVIQNLASSVGRKYSASDLQHLGLQVIQQAALNALKMMQQEIKLHGDFAVLTPKEKKEVEELSVYLELAGVLDYEELDRKTKTDFPDTCCADKRQLRRIRAHGRLNTLRDKVAALKR